MKILDGLISSGTTAALEQMAALTEARQKVLAENIANVDTPGYRRKRIDLSAFQKALAEALENHRRGGPIPQVVTRQVQRDRRGRMIIAPSVEPVENITFHDGSSSRIERDMSEMSKNLLLHQISVELLRREYRLLEMAIKGRMT